MAQLDSSGLTFTSQPTKAETKAMMTMANKQQTTNNT
jgi:hypothetical protein